MCIRDRRCFCSVSFIITRTFILGTVLCLLLYTSTAKRCAWKCCLIRVLVKLHVILLILCNMFLLFISAMQTAVFHCYYAVNCVSVLHASISNISVSMLTCKQKYLLTYTTFAYKRNMWLPMLLQWAASAVSQTAQDMYYSQLLQQPICKLQSTVYSS